MRTPLPGGRTESVTLHTNGRDWAAPADHCAGTMTCIE